MPLISNVQDEPEKIKYYIGFNRGMNSEQDPSLISDKNAVMLKNVMIDIDGITRRYGSTKVFDQGSGTYVYGSAPFYKRSAGTRKFLRIANQRLQYLNGSVWTAIGSTSFANAETNFIQARDNMYIYNGSEALRKYDFSTVTTYTAVTTPTGLAVAATGTTGSTAYSYKISAFNKTGESVGSAAVAIANGNATLSTTNYNTLTWSATSGATGYNIFGRKVTGFGEVYLYTSYTTTYNDTGTDTPVYTHTPQTDNTSGGIIAKGGCFTLGRQFVFGVTEGTTYNPCRISYSGTLEYIDSFSTNDFGGGWVDIYANDGGEIVGIAPYQNGVVVFKTNGIFKLYFTSEGLPALTEITRSHGGVSFKAIQQVDNDILYVGQKENRIAVWTLGQQQNYVGDQLRTNEVSIFIKDSLRDIERAYLSKIASFYFDDKFGFAYTKDGTTENSKGYVLDTRFGAWVEWDGDPMKVSHFTAYDDATDVHLYGGSNTDGYMIELFQTDRNDNGSTFESLVTTKNFNAELFDTDKIWRNPTFWFKYISGGALDGELWTDGTQFQGTVNLTSTSDGSGGIGVDLAGQALAGDFYSSITTATAGADIPIEISTIKISRSIYFNLTDNGNNTNWLFMGLSLKYSPLVGKPLPETNRVQL